MKAAFRSGVTLDGRCSEIGLIRLGTGTSYAAQVQVRKVISEKLSPRIRLAHRSLITLLVAFFLPLAGRAERVEQLKPRGYVNDFAGILDAQAKARINILCAEVEQKTQAQIAVVTIKSLDGESIEEFAVGLATRMGIGHRGDNRGVLILLAEDDRKYRVEVGYGLEAILPDGKVGGFGREMIPKLRAGDYSGALLQLTAQIAGVIAGDRHVALTSLPAAARQSATANDLPSRVPSSLPGLLIFLLFGSPPLSIVLSLIIFLWVLSHVLPIYRGRGRTPRIWGGGPWIGGSGSGSGGFGGGGGFGGFGGGSFGGGGASGGW